MSRYIYGPVPSRRLGRSLGIDLVPLKTCTYGCIYCQLGKTTRKTVQRKEWVPLAEVLEELEVRLASKPDWITISGSGEPTLHSGIGGLIRAIKAITDIPVAVLTNGSLLWLPEVREALCAADLVIPSLDAGDGFLYKHVNRPHGELSFKKVLDGLYEFRKSFTGQYWLEVFLLGGITGLPAQVRDIAKITGRLAPHRIHLNTVVRPAAEAFAFSVPRDLLERFAVMFGSNTEVIYSRRNPPCHGHRGVTPEEILALLSRRPCTLEEIAAGINLDRTEVSRCVEQLSNLGLLKTEHQGRRLYFRTAPPEGS